jgi:predicted nucleotidyltransferase
MSRMLASDAPRRILAEVLAALRQMSGVRKRATFGSVAERRADGWSDVDMFVACEEVERTAWTAAAAIRVAKPVGFYRTFTGVDQPSGRYWFADEAPFNRLDVSFYSTAEFEVVCRDGLKEDMPMFARVEYVADGPFDADQDALLHPPWQRVAIPPEEVVAGRLLFGYLEAAKKERRGRGTADELAEARCALARVLDEGATASPELERLIRQALLLS